MTAKFPIQDVNVVDADLDFRDVLVGGCPWGMVTESCQQIQAKNVNSFP